MSESFFSGIDLQIHRVTRVEAKITERRDCERAMDHDVYELLITARLMGDDGETSLRLVLYTEPGADVGLDPLVDRWIDREMAAASEALKAGRGAEEESAEKLTERQEGVLRRAGLRTDLSRAEATQAIAALAAGASPHLGGYQVTPEIKARWGVDGD